MVRGKYQQSEYCLCVKEKHSSNGRNKCDKYILTNGTKIYNTRDECRFYLILRVYKYIVNVFYCFFVFGRNGNSLTRCGKANGREKKRRAIEYAIFNLKNKRGHI